PPLTTTMSAEPGEPAAVVAVTDVSVASVIDAASAPMNTWAPVRPSPAIFTCVPPAAGPDAGKIEVTASGGSYVDALESVCEPTWTSTGPTIVPPGRSTSSWTSLTG